MVDALEVALKVAAALERAGVGYFLGGSMASSLQGEPRATNDLDFVVDLRETQIDPLVAALGSEFDVDREALYLDRWAGQLGVEDLLQRARAEAAR